MCPYFRPTMAGISIPSSKPGRPISRPKAVCADKAYSSQSNRNWLNIRGIKSNIPRKSNNLDGRSRFNSTMYKGRNIVERFIGWMKEKRRIGTRFEKLKRNFKGMVILAMCQMCLRKMDPSDKA